VVVAVHDWVPLGRLNDLSPENQPPRGTRVAASVGNIVPVVALFVIAIVWSDRPLPLGAAIFAVAYIAVFVVLMWLSWYQPYFFGASEQRERDAEREYGGTVQVLPRRGTHVRPNLMHVILHVLFIVVAIGFLVKIFG